MAALLAAAVVGLLYAKVIVAAAVDWWLPTAPPLTTDAIAAWVALHDATQPLELHHVPTPELPPLPADVLSLQCSDSAALRALGPLPPALTILLCEHCPNLRVIGPLPASLKVLACNGLGACSLPALPPQLTSIWVWDAPGLRQLPPLPSALITLRLHDLTLDALPSLPGTLTQLKLRWCTLRTLPPLPRSLRKLHVRGNSTLRALPPLPPSLLKLHCTCNASLRALPPLPHALQQLECVDNASLSAAPSAWPCNLQKLKWYLNGQGDRALPQLPCGLSKLILDGPFPAQLPLSLMKVQCASHSRLPDRRTPGVLLWAGAAGWTVDWAQHVAALHAVDRSYVARCGALPSAALLYL